MTLLVTGATRKDKSLASSRAILTSIQESISEVQRVLKSLRLKKASLTHCLTEWSIASLGVVLESFENALQQMEHFHHHPRTLKE